MIATIKSKLHTFVTKLIITPSCTKPGNHPLNNNNKKKRIELPLNYQCNNKALINST